MKVLRLTALIALAAVSLAPARPAHAVDYVKVCSLVFNSVPFVGLYLPSTETCWNPATGETVRPNEGGPVFSVLPPRGGGEWVTKPELACQGRLQRIGTFGPADLTLNVGKRMYETRAVGFQLGRKEFISSIMMSGGFAGPAVDFCLSMKDTNGNSLVLGCVQQSLLANTPATFKIAPVRSTPPAGFTAPFSFVGNNSDQVWSGPTTAGSVTLSACIQTAL